MVSRAKVRGMAPESTSNGKVVTPTNCAPEHTQRSSDTVRHFYSRKMPDGVKHVARWTPGVVRWAAG